MYVRGWIVGKMTPNAQVAGTDVVFPLKANVKISEESKAEKEKKKPEEEREKKLEEETEKKLEEEPETQPEALESEAETEKKLQDTQRQVSF